ncbi:MAG: Penicillin-binding protein 2B [Candidatus Peregrinibacteria bacterium GW2011_GWA2_47_7]|nr:MAG: Penicillin-binding protein 2B [Candidatus Peregrinibacteria bacterium GW2011_GWA2_47_7]
MIKTTPLASSRPKADTDAGRDTFEGIGFQEKSERFYPEGELAAPVLGFLNQYGGAYGIERYFENRLQGKKGVFRTQLDATGQQITVGDDIVIQPSIDGDNITLTIDRSVQMEVEKLLAKAVQDSRADSGQVIIMEPDTGKVRAMAQYPSFDSNNFGSALKTEDVYLTEDEKKQLIHKKEGDRDVAYLYLDRDSDYKLQLFKTPLENGKIIYEKYANNVGPGAFLNKAVSEIFEPGSTMKVIAMAIGIDGAGITPNTTYNDTGALKVDEFEIHNATDTYYGITDMNTVIAKSLNTGMAFVARKMGRELFWRYLQKFGFGERTDIEFDGEEEGTLQDANYWAESELVTYAFGQGIAVTPIQMVSAIKDNHRHDGKRGGKRRCAQRSGDWTLRGGQNRHGANI